MALVGTANIPRGYATDVALAGAENLTSVGAAHVTVVVWELLSWD